ncbi:MAG: protein kinase [Polyangiaceae bacterium]
MTHSSSHWQRVEGLFAQALEQPATERDEFLRRCCGRDAALLAELRTLLLAAENSGDFSAAPALLTLARQVSREGWRVRSGDMVASYRIERRLAAGGMGEVWLARDERLAREVAVKFLLPRGADDAGAIEAMQREARAVAALNHPNVVTVHDVGERDGVPYLVTEYLEGESLRARMSRAPMSRSEALDVALQICRGLAAAHRRGLVHRDLKPENVFLTADGRAKILDFGVAMLEAQPAASLDVAGTDGYMAPEQRGGALVDQRADVYALGVLSCEMLTGQRAKLPDPSALARLLKRCMAENPSDRPRTAHDVAEALQALLGARRSVWKSPRFMLAAGALLLTSALGFWHWRAGAGGRWARGVAAPEVQRLLDRGEFTRAFLLARRALDAAPGDALLRRLWSDASTPGLLLSEPADAQVSIAPYDAESPAWFSLGRTPLRDVSIPRGVFKLRIEKAGFRSFEGSALPGSLVHYRLDPSDSAPAGMVRVMGGRAGRFGVVADLDDYFLDRYEVSNAEYQAFVARGGYTRRELWQEPFVDAGRTLSWEEAMVRFRDASGAPGPATWSGGVYPAGRGQFPVSGVSWYEAAAYARFVGKSLPTLFHWYLAAAPGRFLEILTASNFDGKGPKAVGARRGLGAYGTYDMAGNVAEWAWNATERGRFVVGGGWDQSSRMYANCDAKSPFERNASLGFRLAKYERALAPKLTTAVEFEHPLRDASRRVPVSDEIFEVYKRQFAYDRTPLNAELEGSSAAALWSKQSIALDAAYGGERFHVYLFLPKNTRPPYQTVVFAPPSDVFLQRSSSELALAWGEPIVRSGRALAYPVYKGTYERRVAPTEWGSSEARERRIAWSRDLGRTIDYLETRADVDRGKLAFYAVRAGARAVLLSALEPRFRVNVLQGAGIATWSEVAPEIDAVNYAPRIHIPTLMLNARHDFDNPVDAAQRPLFELLGTAAEDKRHTVLEVGHGIPIELSAPEILPWLDRYLGPVRSEAAAPR